jgi:hypothetical protein
MKFRIMRFSREASYLFHSLGRLFKKSSLLDHNILSGLLSKDLQFVFMP